MMLFKKIVIAFAFVMSTSIAAEPLVYIDPATGAEQEIPTLFGIEPNLNQADEEWVLAPDKREVYAPLFTFDMRFNAQSVPYVILGGKTVQKVDFKGGRYRLKAAEIDQQEFKKLLPFTNKKLNEMDTLYLDGRSKLPSTPNLEKMYREETVKNCGQVKYFYRNDENGDVLPPLVKFEKHGAISVPSYSVNKITCTEEGRIILQLALFTPTGGKTDYIINENNEMIEAWTYRPVVAIIDTGIKAVTH